MGTPRLNTVENSALARRRTADDGVVETQLYISDKTLPKSTLPAEMAADPLLTPNEIAEYQRVDPKTVSRWAQKGKFGEAPDVIRLPGKSGARRIRTSAYERAVREANERAGD